MAMAEGALAFLNIGSLLGPSIGNMIPGVGGQVVGGMLNPLGALTGLMGGGQQAPPTPDYSGVIEIAEFGLLAIAGIYLFTTLRRSGGSSTTVK
jgi:hypothetical protein